MSAQLLHHFSPLNKLPPHSYTILPPLAAQLLHHFTPSGQISPSLLQHFNPLAAQLLPQFTISGQITPSLLHHFIPLGSPTITFLPPVNKLPLTLTPFYPSWQPNSYIINPSGKITPHSYTILPPLAAQLLHHFIPSGQITPSLLHHFTPSERITHSLLHYFTPLGSPTLTSFYPHWTNYPLTLTTFYPLGSPTPVSIYPLWTNYPLTLTPFYLSWQPNNYIILPPLKKLPPHSYNILTPSAAQLSPQFTNSGQINPSLLHHFTPLGSPALTSFYPLWTSYPLTLASF